MQFDAKFFTLLIFIFVNFFAIFLIKTRTTAVINVISTNLLVLLFLALSISNYIFLREIALHLIIYSMVVLFLISNYENNKIIEGKTTVNKPNWQKIFLVSFSGLILLALISAVIFNLEIGFENTNLAASEVVIQKNKSYLLDNFLLKRSSDVILIIASAASILLLLSKTKITTDK
jgi:hypothetical protein